MKHSSILLFFLVTLFFQSCIKDDVGMEGIDLSNTLPPYVELKSTSTIKVKQGEAAADTFQMRTGLQQKVTITYDVTGAVNLPNQTLVLNRDELSGTANIAIPAGTITPPATSATATVTLKRAVTESGTELTLGSKNNPASQKVTLNIVP